MHVIYDNYGWFVATLTEYCDDVSCHAPRHIHVSRHIVLVWTQKEMNKMNQHLLCAHRPIRVQIFNIYRLIKDNNLFEMVGVTAVIAIVVIFFSDKFCDAISIVTVCTEIVYFCVCAEDIYCRQKVCFCMRARGAQTSGHNQWNSHVESAVFHNLFIVRIGHRFWCGFFLFCFVSLYVWCVDDEI